MADRCLRQQLLPRIRRSMCGWVSRTSRLGNRHRSVYQGQQRYRRDQLSHVGFPELGPLTMMVTGSSITRCNAAKMMGADALQTFIYVTMPSVRSGFIAGALFTFILSFDNYTVSLFLTDPQTETLPIRMLKFTQVRVDPTVAAAATILIGLSL